MAGVVKVKVIRQSYFAMGVRVSERHLLGNWSYPQGREERESVLTGAMSVHWLWTGCPIGSGGKRQQLHAST